MRPWLLGTLSINLLTSTQVQLKANLNPGFCPYLPTLNIEDIY